MTLSLLWSQQRQTSAPSGPAEYSWRPSIRIPVVRFDLVNKCWSISKARLGWGFMFRLGTCLGLISHLLTFWFVVIAEMKTDRLLKIMSVKCYFDLLVLWHHYPRSFGSFRCKSMQVDALRFSKLRFETPFSWTLMLSVLIFLFLRLLFKSCLLQKNACSEPLVSLEPWKTCDLTQSSKCKRGASNRTLWNCFRNFVSKFPFLCSSWGRSSHIRLGPSKLVLLGLCRSCGSLARHLGSLQQLPHRRRSPSARAASFRNWLQLHPGQPRKPQRPLRQFSILILRLLISREPALSPLRTLRQFCGKPSLSA